MISLKRVYDPPLKEDGYRILVDRLWPRGLTKEKARVDLWLKEIAPSDSLRKWFNHEVEKWPEFQKRYQDELKDHSDLTNQIKDLEKKEGKVTLVFGAKDTEHNQAVVLKDLLT